MEEPVQGAVQASIPRLVRAPELREFRCPEGHLLFKEWIEGGTVEIRCRYCKRLVVLKR